VEYQLANGETHAMHGDVQSRAWFMQEASQEHICCRFESAWHRDLNWPWPFEARVKYSLDRNEFSSELVLRKCGSTAMLAGLGWHSYFNQELTTKGEAVHLHMKVLGSYPDLNDNRIPSGPPQPLTPEQDFSVEKPLPDDRFLDTCFYGYDGNGCIVWPDSKVKLTFECSADCSHLVIYNPVGLPYFAVEPVTNANNGVNLYAGSESYQRGSLVVVRRNSCSQVRFTGRYVVMISCPAVQFMFSDHG